MPKGLKAGDVIVSMGGDGITTVDDVYGVLDGHSSGDSLAIVREREKSEFKIALGGAPMEQPSHAMLRHGNYGHGFHGHGFNGSQGMMPRHGCGMRKGQRSS